VKDDCPRTVDAISPLVKAATVAGPEINNTRQAKRRAMETLVRDDKRKFFPAGTGFDEE